MDYGQITLNTEVTVWPSKLSSVGPGHVSRRGTAWQQRVLKVTSYNPKHSSAIMNTQSSKKSHQYHVVDNIFKTVCIAHRYFLFYVWIILWNIGKNNNRLFDIFFTVWIISTYWLRRARTNISNRIYCYQPESDSLEFIC